MSRPAACVTDPTVLGGFLATGATSVLVGSLPMSRVMDDKVCPRCGAKGMVLPAAATVRVAGLPPARVGDSTLCRCGATDTIAGGNTMVLIGTAGTPQTPRSSAGTL